MNYVSQISHCLSLAAVAIVLFRSLAQISILRSNHDSEWPLSSPQPLCPPCSGNCAVPLAVAVQFMNFVSQIRHWLSLPAVAIVLFRSLARFSGASFTLGTLPAVMLQFVALALGSLLVGPQFLPYLFQFSFQQLLGMLVPSVLCFVAPALVPRVVCVPLLSAGPRMCGTAVALVSAGLCLSPTCDYLRLGPRPHLTAPPCHASRVAGGLRHRPGLRIHAQAVPPGRERGRR